MSSVVHFKFQSSLSSDIVRFDGLDISVRDLKLRIADAKNLDKYLLQYDLIIKNPQTDKAYGDDDKVLRNSTIFVSRTQIDRHKSDKNCVPLYKSLEMEESRVVDWSFLTQAADSNISEEEKLSRVMQQACEEFDGVDYKRAKQLVRRPVPRNYICHGCGSSGHYIQNCPRMKNRKEDETIKKLKLTTGIPKTFLTSVDDINAPGVLLSGCGKLVVSNLEAQSNREKASGGQSQLKSEEKTENQGEIPEHFLCRICNQIQTDSVCLPCCANSACDFCAITELLRTQKCTLCNKTGVSVTEVTPNEGLRIAILKHTMIPDIDKYLTAKNSKLNPKLAKAKPQTEACNKVNAWPIKNEPPSSVQVIHQAHDYNSWLTLNGFKPLMPPEQTINCQFPIVPNFSIPPPPFRPPTQSICPSTMTWNLPIPARAEKTSVRSMGKQTRDENVCDSARMNGGFKRKFEESSGCPPSKRWKDSINSAHRRFQRTQQPLMEWNKSKPVLRRRY